MMDNVKELLLPASRQYRHNNSDNFVAAYGKEETEIIVYGLLYMINSLIKHSNKNES